MKRTLLIGGGGFVGTIARHALGEVIQRLKSGALFPYEIVVINVIGCLATG